MGSEIIIPGTPIGSIPPYDRPNFDPKQQNGFLGSLANLAAPPPGSLRQRYNLVVANSLATGGALPKTAGATFSVASGATSAALGSATIIGINTWPAMLARVKIYLPAADTTAPVALKTSWNSQQVNLPAQQFLTFENLDVASAFLVNNDSVARTVNLTILPEPTLLDVIGVDLNLNTLLGLQVNAQDVLRVRAMSFQLWSAGGSGFFGDAAVARIGNQLASPNTPARVFLLRNPWKPSDAQIRSIGADAAVSYLLDGPVDILGTDFNFPSPWNPILRLEHPSATQAQNFDYSIFGLFDLYVGANQ